MRIIIGADHAGYDYKEQIVAYLKAKKFNVLDFSYFDKIKCDYPDIAKQVCRHIEPDDIGILICGTGIGMSIVANRDNRMCCALCHNCETAKLSREHNNANILALGARVISEEDIFDIVDAFIDTPFSKEERHIQRINKINSEYHLPHHKLKISNSF